MITDAILTLSSTFYNYLISLVPKFEFLEDLIQYKEQFIDFLKPYISYTLWFFNPTILKLSFSVLGVYFVFLGIEYFIKLFIKYTLEVLP